jgi:HEAT repeat protein
MDIPYLAAELACLDVHRRERARRLLAALGAAATPELIRALDDPLEWVRWEAATILGMTAECQAIPTLVTALKDSSPAVRLAAAEALIAIGKPATLELLTALADHPQSIELRQGARRVLGALARKGRLSPEAGQVYASLRRRKHEPFPPDGVAPNLPLV